MFMKHYAPNRCEPSIEAMNFGPYKKVLYNIKKIKKCVCVWGGGGGGAIFEPKTLSTYLKKKKKKKMTEPGLEPTTSGLEIH